MLSGAPVIPRRLVDDADVVEAVRKDPGAIGFLPVSWLEAHAPEGVRRVLTVPPLVEGPS